MKRNFVPSVVVSRLPLYYKMLNQMAKAGWHHVSSAELGDRLGLTAAQIRKDLSYFGGFGKQGTGYNIYYLLEELKSILNMDRIWSIALVGVGDLGRALVRYQGFAKQGLEIILLFDVDPELIGKQVGHLVIHHSDLVAEKIRDSGVKIAILTVPEEAAQNTADRLIQAGVRCILNYTPVRLLVPESVHVQHIDPVLQIQQMLYFLD
jgi:redox-sensing transcriptional repressor